MILIHKNVLFPPKMRVFTEIRKSINLEEFSKFAEDSIFFQKRFHPLKGIASKARGRKICRCRPAVLFLLHLNQQIKQLYNLNLLINLMTKF